VSRLSVITPIFNSADYLDQLLDSVAALTGDVEHIVMDGGSQDGTVQVLQSRGDPRLTWRSEPDRGQTHAVNKGIARATGDILNWINGDNAYLPNAVRRALDLLEARPDVDAVFGGIDFIDEHGRFRRRYIPGRWSWRRYLYVGDYVPTETIFFRRELLERAPGLDEHFADAADYDFYLRLLHRRRVEVLREPLILYRYHPASKTARDPWLAQGEHRAIRAAWARRPADRAVMTAIDATKRAVLPRVSEWPRPYPAD
jgi:glycosyltransferase involved in cell wall biosynthesis